MSSNITPAQGMHIESHQEVDLARLLGELVDHRLCIFFVTVVFTLAALAYTQFTTPIYIADAMVQVEQDKGNSLLKDMDTLSPGLSPDATPEIQLLQSRMVLGKTVEDLDLCYVVTQKFFPIVGKGWSRLMGRTPGKINVVGMSIPQQDGHFPALTLTVETNSQFLIEGEGFSARGHVGTMFNNHDVSLMVNSLQAEPGTQFTLQERTTLTAINDLDQRLSVAEKAKGSGILGMTLSGPDREMNARILNSIAHNYLQQNIERQAAQDSKSLEFLRHQLPAVRNELDFAEERLNGYRKTRDSVDLNLEAKSVLEQIVNADSQLNELTFREAEVSQRYKKNHPIYRALLEKRQTLEQEKARLNTRVSAMPSTQQEIIRLSRDVDSGRAVFLQLLTRQQELNISKSSTVGNVRIIDEAITQPDAIKPKKALIVVFGLVLGFMLSAGAVLLRAALRRGIEIPEQLEELGINVYATLPHSEWLAKRTRVRHSLSFSSQMRHKTQDIPFLPTARPMDLFVESIRGLRTSLHFAMMDSGNNILMFSGPTQDCGKTLVSSSLASIVAQVGQKVLFIDADMRRGYSHNIFKIKNDGGLSGILAGKMTTEKAIQPFVEGGFDVITCGQVPPNPSELLMHERFKLLMAWASEHYDMVIVDTPPVLAVTDASLVGRFCGTTLLVARFGITSIKEVLVCARRLQQAGVNTKGAILNDVVKRAANFYRTGFNHFEYGYNDESYQSALKKQNAKNEQAGS